MTPDDVARIVDFRSDAEFVIRLRSADGHLEDEAFEAAVAEVLRKSPDLVSSWQSWSQDQRWTPSVTVDGLATGWVPRGGGIEHLTIHSDPAAAVADFIHRLAAWLARREVLEL